MNDPAGGESISAASLFGIIHTMYATTSLRDAYRKFRAKDPSYLYAFGQQEFLVFVMGDAKRVNEIFPDMEITQSPAGYSTVRVHSQAFFQLVYRLTLRGEKVAMVARRVNDRGLVSYSISERFDAERMARDGKTA